MRLHKHMVFRASVSAGLIAFLFGSVVLVSTPASALTVQEIQAQIQSVISNVANFRAQSQTPAAPSATIANPIAQHRVCIALHRNLSRGMRGDDVVALQEFLQAQGHFNANATGYFGPATRAALSRWQAGNGISAVGIVGPLTRARIVAWCGGSGGTVVPPPPQTDPSADPRCRAWYDGCNDCSRSYPGGPAACTLRACIWQAPAYCKEYYDGGAANRPPTISSFSGPTVLQINQTGMWSVQVSDPENGPLSYNVVWGDEQYAAPMASMTAGAFVQTTTFTHSYARAGTYTIVIHARDSAGQQAQTTSTVRVESAPQYCTMEYAPVCGQKTSCPACNYSEPACLMPCSVEYKTYGNRCVMNADGATLVHEGACANPPYQP